MYIFHTTSSGERWDTIAYKYYGNCYDIAPLIMANPHIPISPIFEEGLEIKVPLQNIVNKSLALPIWKQGDR